MFSWSYLGKSRLPPKGSERLIPCQKSVPFSPCTTSTNSSKPLIYFVTPTYPRREQAAELTRLAQTLLHIKDLHWVLAEDAKQCSNLIPSLMKRYPTLPFTYLASPIPEMYTRLPKKEIPRGVSSRRAALSLITDWHNKTACSNREAGKHQTKHTQTRRKKSQTYPVHLFWGPIVTIK